MRAQSVLPANDNIEPDVASNKITITITVTG